MRNRFVRRGLRMPSPAMVVALAALFVALGGSASAAVLITSADIRNGTIRGIDVRNGALGGLDLRNNSVRGADVRESTLAKVPNANRLDGLDSTRFLPGGTLPRGATIRGVYKVRGMDQGANADVDTDAISFGFTLASAPTRHFIAAGGTPPAECPGSVAFPRAAPGHLCVYEQQRFNAVGIAISNPTTNSPGASRFGAVVTAFAAQNGAWLRQGAWAVTAP